jgi:hypothetical protein
MAEAVETQEMVELLETAFQTLDILLAELVALEMPDSQLV